MVVPKLRFQEFDGDWPSIPLKNFVSFRKGKGISKADIQEDGVFECIRYGELYTTYGQVITTIKSRTNISPSESILSQSGDVIIPTSGETQIDIATASCVAKENVILGGDLNILSHNESGEWLAYYLSSAKKLEIAQLAQGNSVVHLYSSQLKELKVNRPSKEEQTKIATFLSAVDEKIAQLSQKLHLLGQYKQGMMQKLFSQQIRFKADDGSDFWEWEETQLISISEIIMGSSPKSENYNENSIGLPLLQGNADIKNRKSAPRLYTSEITKTCDINDILLSVRAPVGFVAVSKHIACIGRGLCSIRAKNEYSQDFLYQWLLNHEKLWVSLSQGSTFDSVNSEQIKKLCILVPCLEEQTKIANFLSTIDKKMDVVSEQLKQTKTWKKGLLQQMFV